MDKEQAAKIIGELPGEAHLVMVLWLQEDILDRAEERGIGLSKKQADEILDLVERKQDACIGVNWNVLDCWTDDYLQGDN